MRRLGLVYLIAFLFSFCALFLFSNNAVAQGVSTDYSNIKQMIEQGQFQDALNLVSQSGAAISDPALAYYKALALAGLNRRSPAISELNRAISLDPSNSDYYLRRGLLWLKSGRPSEAIADFTAALELTPTLASALRHRASALLSTGQASRALEDTNNALRLSPSNPDLYKLRGDVCSSMGDFGAAVKDYNKAIGLDPYLITAINNRAIALANLNKAKEALEDLNSAMELSITRPSSSSPAIFQGSQW